MSFFSSHSHRQHFNAFNEFVELAKNPHVIRELKVTGQIDMKHVKVPTLVIHQLIEQLQLCVATAAIRRNGLAGYLICSPSHSFAIFSPALVRSGINFLSPS